MNRSVDVIIPTLSAARSLPRLLHALTEQTVRSLLLVVDSASRDGTPDIARSLGAAVLPVRAEEFDHGGTRSFAAKQGSGEFVLFLTQDAVPADRFAVENLLRPFGDERVAAAYGRQLPAPGADPFAAHMRAFKYPPESRLKSAKDRDRYGIDTPAISNSFAAYRRKAMDEIGWFKSGTLFAEDALAGAGLLLRGHCIAYAADARVYHSHNHSAIEEFRRYFDNGVFYRTERWIREEFGGNRGEGWRYLWSELRYLQQHGHLRLVPQALVRDLFRIVGYGLGLNFTMLPRGMCKRLSTNRGWWEKAQR